MALTVKRVAYSGRVSISVFFFLFSFFFLYIYIDSRHRIYRENKSSTAQMVERNLAFTEKTQGGKQKHLSPLGLRDTNEPGGGRPSPSPGKQQVLLGDSLSCGSSVYMGSHN
jgi:hypothetical protein